MPIYRGEFSNINGDKYRVEFRVGTNTVVQEITMGDEPCVIEQKSDGLFSPIKSRSATFNIVSDDYIFDLYTPLSRGIRATVYDSSLNVIFHGYVRPNIYDQTYTYLDTITIEAVDAVSTLQDYRYYLAQGTAPKYNSLLKYIYDFLVECGYNGNLYIQKSYDIDESQIIVSEADFFDDDEEHQGWTKYEILEQICLFMGMSLTVNGHDVWIVDYRSNADTSFKRYNLDSENIDYTGIEVPALSTVQFEGYAPGTANISLEPVYNKIEISDNLYEITEIAPDIFDENIHESITDSRDLGPNGAKWTRTTVKKRWLREDVVTTDTIGYQYRTICKLNNKATNWKHRFYKHSTRVEVDDYYDSTSLSQYVTDRTNKYCNTHGCLIQHYAYRPNNGDNIIPTSIDWNDYLTFFVMDDTTPSFSLLALRQNNPFELPVLEYNIDEHIMYKPSTPGATSWITIKGDLFYQYNGARFGEKDKTTLNIINTTDKIYQVSPVDKCCEITEQKYVSMYRVYGVSPDYGKGFNLWKMRLQIGNKCWNGTSWEEVNPSADESTYPTFYIPYNNSPADRGEEYVSAFAWMSPVPNVSFTDKVGEDAYCIPIAANDNNAPESGTLKLTIFTPSIAPPELIAFLVDNFDVYENPWIDWMMVPPVIYCKSFELGYVFTDSQVWYSQKKSGGISDVVYTNLINASYTNEFNDIELKINTQQKDKPISRSYACLSGGGYLMTRKHVNGDETKDQEKNVIDLWYYHYNEPKLRYKCNVHEIVHSAVRYNFKNTDPISETIGSGNYLLVDNYSYDIAKCNTRVELVKY